MAMQPITIAKLVLLRRWEKLLEQVLRVCVRYDDGSMSTRERQRDYSYRQPSVQFQCSIKNLQDLMQTRGVEAFAKLQQEFGGVIELCRRLYTSPTEGQFLVLTMWTLCLVTNKLHFLAYTFKITLNVISVFGIYSMTVSSQRLHILKVLKRQGLSLEMLHNFYAIIVSKIACGISFWYSFLTKAQIAQINSLFERAFKYGYVKLYS